MKKCNDVLKGLSGEILGGFLSIRVGGLGTYFDIRDQRYQTELDIDIGLKRAESDIILDIGINFYPIS
jgi:hypothetical protein